MRKKLLPLIVFMMASIAGFSQFYYLPFLYEHQNPNGLNADAENPVNAVPPPPGWASLHPGNAASSAWGSTGTIPFTFTFNGNPFTQFKASTSGVVTFDLTAATPPSYTKEALPSALIPDNSICFWGIAGTGSNDNILTKTFGTAPNRQFWIQFNSYSQYPAVTGSYIYVAVVLEETTNNIYFVEQRNGATVSPTACIGLQFNSTSAVTVAGAPSTPILSGTAITADDNIYYKFIQGTQSVYDAYTHHVSLADFLLQANAPFNIVADLDNHGTSAITSMDVNYNIDGGTTVTASLTGLNIASLGTYSYTHPTSWNPSSAGLHTIRIWASNLNGNADQNHSDDTLTKVVNVYTSTGLAQRKVLVEEFTQASCPPCASQNPVFDALIDANLIKVSPVKYHTSWPGYDPMYNFNTVDPSDRVAYYGIFGVPMALIDGVQPGPPAGVDQTTIDDAYAIPSFFNITGTATLTGSNLDINYSTNSLIDFPGGNLKAHCEVVEDPVDYANAPGTNGETSFPSVLRKSLPDATGAQLAPPANGQVNNFNYSYTVPAVIVKANLKVAVYIQNFDTKEVYQSAIIPVIITGIETHDATVNGIALYPNPTSTSSSIQINLLKSNVVKFVLYNSLGENVLSESVGKLDAGTHQLSLTTSALAAGMYQLNVYVGDNVYTIKMNKMN
ncbi:MAG: T9SS type A sorting domain-containing protein [Bacteroidia bacterium]